MKEFIKKHPALADVCDVILSLLCGSFALLAFGMVRRYRRIKKEQ